MFKVGDKVKCINTATIDNVNDSINRLTLYKVYTIERESSIDTVVVKDDTGEVHPGFFASRFELVKEEKVSPSIFKVRCIDSSDFSLQLTTGKEYEVISEDGPFYQIISNTRTKGGFLKERFEKVTSDPIPTAMNHISFSGPGRYELINGQIVNLNGGRVCLKSDGVKDLNGETYDWMWCQDGTTLGINTPDITQLYLAKKLDPLPDPESEYVTEDPNEIVEITDKNHIGRACDFVRLRSDDGWHPLQVSIGKTLDSPIRYMYGCKRKDLPIIKEDEIPTKYGLGPEDPEEIVVITDGDHTLRGCDYIKCGSGEWNPVNISVGYNINSFKNQKDTSFGCKRRNLPTKYNYKIIDNKHTYDNLVKDRSRYFVDTERVAGCDITLKKEEEEMKKETAIAAGKTVGKFAASWTFKALNYWVFEPAAGIGRPIMKSVRYATFLGGLAACSYGYYHPDVVMDGIKSCLPKISIEAPSILQGDEKVEKA